jgi:hypothetical protein
MNSNRYVLIAGQGRSGTNWLLEIFDWSRRTHCRNEPNECAGSALAALPPGWVSSLDLNTKLESVWDEAVVQTSQSFGDRDHPIKVYKDHFSRLAQQIGLVRLAKVKRHRRILRGVMPAWMPEEWPIPPWIVNEQKQDQSLPIFKTNAVPGWIVWALRNRPGAHVVHIVRHPAGFLNSYLKRWLSQQSDLGKVERDNRDGLTLVATHEPAWASRFGDISTISLLEAELWYWRYCAETIHRAGEGSPRYQLVKYEELTRNPVETSRSVYGGCGLDWDRTIEQAVRESSSESQAIATAWRDRLSAEHVALVERILDNSMMQDWWN